MSEPKRWRALPKLWWFLRPCPLWRATEYNLAQGYNTWWRGVVIGPIAIGVLWRTKFIPAESGSRR